MKKFLLAALKYTLIVSLVLLIVMLSFGFVLWMSWPWWVGLFFLVGLAGLWLVWIFIRKLLLRRKEQQFVQQVIEQDEAYLQGMAGGDQEGLHDLQERWKKAISTLKGSHLKKFGNPLYVLPWYMVIGESGSGKTTAIKSAGLSAPFVETNKVSGISGTRNCDWWFFDQAIILDTAGRYTVPVNEGQDKKEWQKFLSLLLKYRKKEPLNGLVITLGAERLLDTSQQKLENDSQIIRQRIDELMRALGTRFPVYVLITKCDLVQGMTQFCNLLPEKCLDQAMGMLNQDISSDIDTMHSHLMEGIGNRLQELRLNQISQTSPPGASDSSTGPELLLFPEEFQGIGKNLLAFLRGTFKQTPYQETPILRGVFFSSGRQEGTPYSHFLNALGLIKPQEVLPGTSRGLFLHDLFSRILPEDKKLFAPTARSLAWGRLTRNIGVAALMTIVLALCGLLSFAFVQNLGTIRKAGDAFTTSIALRGNLQDDTLIMGRYARAVSQIEEYNGRWWFPRFGLNESRKIENRIKEKYCRQFYKDFASSFDRRLKDTTSGFSMATPDEKLGSYTAHLTRRINLLKARLDNLSLAGRPTPSFRPILASKAPDLAAKTGKLIGEEYLLYLRWQTRADILNEELARLQTMLRHIVTLPGTNLNWLVAWVNTDSGLKPLTLRDFWGNHLTKGDTASVPPAFTLKGKKQIDGLLAEIDSATNDPLILSTKKVKFAKWYTGAYIQVWYDFGNKFPEAEYYLADKTAWQQLAASMNNGPYFSVINTMATELRGMPDTENPPEWIPVLFQIERAILAAKGQAAVKKGSFLSKVTQKGKKVIDTLGNNIEKTGSSPGNPLQAGEYIRAYKENLNKLIIVSSSRQVAFQTATDIFKDDPATSKSPFYLGQHNLALLQREIHSSSAQQKMIWRLVSGPLRYLRDYVCLEASCRLNALWEKDVLVEIQGVNDKSKLNDLLFENNGFALRFLQGPVEPFLSRSLKKGFYPKTALGRMLPFKPAFLSFLTDGIRLAKFKPNFNFDSTPPPQLTMDTIDSSPPPTSPDQPAIPGPIHLKDKYTVVINAQPTSVNKGARIIPHETDLELVCDPKTTRLANLNYPIRKAFNWYPKDCKEVNLQIDVGSLVLKHQYTGKFAFPLFIRDFKSGSRTFKASDFPDERKLLGRMNIQTITVSFTFDGIQPILAIIAQEDQRLAALNKAEEARAKNPGNKGPNITEVLLTLERKHKQEKLENEALKQAWKEKQAQKSAAMKRAWEEKLPDVPAEISTCWD